MRRMTLFRRPTAYRYEDEARQYDHYYDDRYYDEDDYEYDDKPTYRSRYDRFPRYRERAALFVLPNEDVANAIMNTGAFGEYIARHGYHFTADLADCATKMLKNANHREHRWTSDQIRQQLAIHGLNDWGKCTLGDITFLANMAYADFYPEVLSSEHACIKYAIAVAKDPDGYDGIVFSRWIADLIGNKVTTIDWERYV